MKQAKAKTATDIELVTMATGGDETADRDCSSNPHD